MGYIQPSLRLALCEMASSSLPALRCLSIQFHRSSGCQESKALKGAGGSWAQSRKKTLRCRLRLSYCEVHSYEQKAVNLPGWLFSSAALLFSLQTVLATFSLISSLFGGPLMSLSTARKTPCTSAGLLGSLKINGWAAGSLLVYEPGVFACFVTPTYSEWSVTPMKSNGVSMWMS